MKLLYIINQSELKMHNNTINYLTNKGFDVAVETLNPDHNRNGIADFEEFHGRVLKNVRYYKEYDFLIIGIHIDHFIKIFLKNLERDLRFIDIDHDLFDGIPLNTTDLLHEKRRCAVVSFTKIQHKLAKRHLSNMRQIINCRWYKLDADYEQIDTQEIDKWNDIIVIGTMVFGTNNRNRIEELSLFDGLVRKIWYKKKYPHWENPLGTEPLPDIFSGPEGIKYCCDACRFIVSRCSGCIVESILFGSIPIVLPYMISFEEKENDIISRVSLKYSLSHPKGPSVFTENPVKVITTTDLENKIKALRSNKKLYKKIHKELFYFWFGENYFSLPSLGEAIYRQVKKYETT